MRSNKPAAETIAWWRFWSWLTTRQTCRECRLLRVEAEDINCPCLTRWPDGLKGNQDRHGWKGPRCVDVDAAIPCALSGTPLGPIYSRRDILETPK